MKIDYSYILTPLLKFRYSMMTRLYQKKKRIKYQSGEHIETVHYYTTLQNRILKVNVMYSHRAVTVTCHHEGHPNDKHPLGYT
jgi:hypothetical protein